MVGISQTILRKRGKSEGKSESRKILICCPFEQHALIFEEVETFQK